MTGVDSLRRKAANKFPTCRAQDAVAVRRGFDKPENVRGWTEYNEGKSESIEGVKVIDDTTIEFTLVEGDARFFDTVRWFYVLPEHAVDFSSAELQTTDWFRICCKAVRRVLSPRAAVMQRIAAAKPIHRWSSLGHNTK